MEITWQPVLFGVKRGVKKRSECMSNLYMYKFCFRWQGIVPHCWYSTEKIDLRCIRNNNKFNTEERKFHLQKQLLKYAGKYLKEITINISTGGSGILTSLSECCKYLKKIKLILKNSDVDTTAFDEPFASMLTLSCINVQDNFPYPQYRNDHALMYEQIFGYLPENIDEIIISASTCMTPALLPIKTLRHCENYQHLTRLTIHHRKLEAAHVQAISLVVQLTYLNLEGCKIEREHCAQLVSLINLISLNIKAVHFFPPEILLQILQLTPSMKNLNIASTTNYLPDMLERIVNINSNLESIRVDEFNQISPESFVNVARKCKKLKALGVFDSWNLDILTLKTIPRLIQLEKLIIKNNDNATDDIFGNQSQLIHLNFVDCSGCMKITDAAIQALIKKCKNLRHLNVVNTAITTETLEFALTMKRDEILEIFTSVRGAINLNFTSIHLMNLKDK